MTVFDLDPSLSQRAVGRRTGERSQPSGAHPGRDAPTARRRGEVFPVEVRGNLRRVRRRRVQLRVRPGHHRAQAGRGSSSRARRATAPGPEDGGGGAACRGIAHDFNNLMAAVVGYSDLLLAREGAFDLSVREDIEEIRHAADRASSLTKQILAFSRRQALRPTSDVAQCGPAGHGPASAPHPGREHRPRHASKARTWVWWRSTSISSSRCS